MQNNTTEIRYITDSRWSSLCDKATCHSRNNGSGYCSKHHNLYWIKQDRKAERKAIFVKIIWIPVRFMFWAFYIKPKTTRIDVSFNTDLQSPTALGLYD